MIKQAIIPLAGLGTRLLPLTSVMPKELMPINGKPNLQYILEECIDAGIKEFIFIISKKKLSIKKYFFNDNFYKKIIKKKKDKRLIEEFKKIRRYQKMIKMNSFTPASIHSSNIYCKFGLPLMGINSFGITLVKGSILVPNPANGIMACFII